mgnify:CR=1 FL=1
MSEALAQRLVVGLQGAVPTSAELLWLAAHRPAGVILFARNVLNYSQLSELCHGLKTLVPGLEIVADHEGGPVSVLAAAVETVPGLEKEIGCSLKNTVVRVPITQGVIYGWYDNEMASYVNMLGDRTVSIAEDM